MGRKTKSEEKQNKIKRSQMPIFIGSNECNKIKFFANVLDFIVTIIIIESITNNVLERDTNMTRNEAKLELFKVNRKIEKKVTEYSNELGQYNKSIVMRELELLWNRKDILKNIINS